MVTFDLDFVDTYSAKQGNKLLEMKIQIKGVIFKELSLYSKLTNKIQENDMKKTGTARVQAASLIILLSSRSRIDLLTTWQAKLQRKQRFQNLVNCCATESSRWLI